MPDSNFLAFIVSEISAFIRTDSDSDQECIYFIGCYILSVESSIPFYSTNNGYNNDVNVTRIFRVYWLLLM